MSDDIDLSFHVEQSDLLIDVAKRVVRTLGDSPTAESEKSLAENMVRLRNLLVGVRDEVKKGSGPMLISEGEFMGSAFTHFNEAYRTLATAYIEIQQKRYDDVDWSEAATERAKLIDGIKLLLEFQAFIYSWEHGLSLRGSKHNLQLARDRRRIKAPPESDDPEPLVDEPQWITAEEMAKLYDISVRTARERLKTHVEPKEGTGTQNNPYLFDRKKAMDAFRTHYHRASTLATSQNGT